MSKHFKCKHYLGNIIKLNKWHHIAGVIDPRNDSMKIFINGVEVGRRDFKRQFRLHKSLLPLRIGSSHEDRPAASPFVGYIDEVRIWNIARTGEEIRADMDRKLKGNEPGLIGYWNFDTEADGDGIISDKTPNQIDGRFVGKAHLTNYILPIPEYANPDELAKLAIVYENLLTPDINNYDAFHYLAQIYTKTNRNKDAEKVYQRALKANLMQSDHENAIKVLQKLYADRNATNEFIVLLKEMSQKMTNSTIYFEILGDGYKKLGDEENANIAYSHWLTMRIKEIEKQKHASDYHLFPEELLEKNIFPKVAYNMASKAIEMHSGTSYRMTYIHAFLMNEMYEQSSQLISNFLNAGYFQYTERSLFSRIVKAGKNVKDKDGYVEMLNNLIDAMSNDLPDQLNTMLTLAQFYKENNRHDKATELIQQTGFIMEDDWMILGPFDNFGGIGFNTQYIPENLPQIDIESEYDGLNGPVRWQKHTDDILNGYIDLIPSVTWSISYAYTTILSPDEREVDFRFDSNDQGKIWINGIEVHAHTRTYAADIDREIIHVTLNPGINSILIKVCEEYKGTGFYLRITDKDGKPIDDLESLTLEDNQ